jgi:hypothetical protein
MLFLFVFTGFFFFTGLFLSDKSLGQDNDTEFAVNTSALPTAATTNESENFKNDTIPPNIDIKYPAYPPTITTGKINILLTTNDSGSGIHNVSAAAHVFPFEGNFPINLAVLPSSISSDNESHWEIPMVINTTGTYRVVIDALDNAGNPAYAETTINAAIPEKNLTEGNTTDQLNPKIAFVRPTFTEAAYQEHGFYTFYDKYGVPPLTDDNITTDLDMLTVKTPRSIAELYNRSNMMILDNLTALIPINGTELDDVSWYGFPDPQPFWMPFVDHVKKDFPNATVTVMRDEDVSDGHIFYTTDNKTNAYDVLMLFHNEYMTQNEYDNLRQFVKNGGNLVPIDGNPFYAEVKYDRDNQKISLVKGHGWQFDGEVARESVDERWINETKEWLGSSYMINSIENKITFDNNPFNYTHFEENYVNNPNVTIIHDYEIKHPPQDLVNSPELKDMVVATYTLDYGKGKILMLGIWGDILYDNELFFKYFDDWLITHVYCYNNTQPCNPNQNQNQTSP